LIPLRNQKKTILKMVEPLKTGELLLKEGLIRRDDIDLALSIQEKRQASLSLKKSRLLGMILCDLNLITPIDNYYILHKYNKLMTIQSALISQKMVSKEVVQRTEDESIQQDIPFISLLHKTRLVSTSELQRLLFDLFHIPFRSISNFVFEEKERSELIQVLGIHQSLKNRIIPLVLKNNTILFGITDPENILFIQKLNGRFPQYRFKTVFIHFAGFSKGYKILYENLKPLDLSLLLNFKISIKDPEQENEYIRTLYKQYELLRLGIGNTKRNDLQSEFSKFIIQSHRKITREQKNQIIEFSLKKEGRVVKVIAAPKDR